MLQHQLLVCGLGWGSEGVCGEGNQNLKSSTGTLEKPSLEDSRDGGGAKMNLYLDQMEELQYRLEEHIGRSQKIYRSNGTAL